MKLERGLHREPGVDAIELERQLRREGWFVFSLPPDIVDRDTFFIGVRGTLPLNPPVIRNDIWDALSDSLWSGLDELDSDRIAIIWPDSAQMARPVPDEFEIAIEILSDLTDSLADSDATVGHPKQVMVVVT